MKSLSQLNARGTSSLNYTDDRNASITFDRDTPSNQSLSIASGQPHTAQPGILILDIIKPDSLNIYYEIDVSNLAGATVSWPNLPAGVTLTNLSSGKYRITNIDTVAQWDAIKAPIISNPGITYAPYIYIAGIYYDPSKSKVWYTNVTITVRAVLTSVSTQLSRITGIQQARSNLNAVSSISNFLAGFRKQASLAISTVSSLTIVPKATKRGISLEAGVSTLTVVNAKFSGATSNMTAITTTISIGTFVVRPTIGISALMQHSSIIGPGWGSPTTYQDEQYPSDYYQHSAKKFFSVNNYAFVSDPNGTNTTTSGQTRNSGNVKVYVAADDTAPYFLQTTLRPDQSYIDATASFEASFYDFGKDVAINSNATRIAVLASEEYNGNPEIYIFDRSGTTWTRTQRLSVTYAAFNIAMSSDGNYICYSQNLTNTLRIYKYNAGTYSLQQTMDLTSINSGNTLYSNTAQMNSDGSKILIYSISGSGSNGNIFTLQRTGTTWTNSGTFNLNGIEKLQNETLLDNAVLSLSPNWNYGVIQTRIDNNDVAPFEIADADIGALYIVNLNAAATGYTSVQRINFSNGLTMPSGLKISDTGTIDLFYGSAIVTYTKL